MIARIAARSLRAEPPTTPPTSAHAARERSLGLRGELQGRRRRSVAQRRLRRLLRLDRGQRTMTSPRAPVPSAHRRSACAVWGIMTTSALLVSACGVDIDDVSQPSADRGQDSALSAGNDRSDEARSGATEPSRRATASTAPRTAPDYVEIFCRTFGEQDATLDAELESIESSPEDPVVAKKGLGEVVDSVRSAFNGLRIRLRNTPPPEITGGAILAERFDEALDASVEALDEIRQKVDALDPTSSDFRSEAIGVALGMAFALTAFLTVFAGVDLAAAEGDLDPEDTFASFAGSLPVLRDFAGLMESEPACAALATPEELADSTERLSRLNDLANGDVVISGIGPFRAGMTVREAEASLGLAFDVENFDDFEGRCYSLSVDGIPGLLLMAEADPPVSDPLEGIITRITVLSDHWATRSEVRVGDPAGRVRSTYGSAIRSSAHEYALPPGEYLDFVPSDEADQAFGLRFEVDESGNVTHIHAGLVPSVHYVEGCA